jgi:hypothetical protein
VAQEGDERRAKRHALLRHANIAQRRAARMNPTLQGLLWSALAGITFAVLNAVMRGLTLQLDPFHTQFLRYLFGVLVMVPLVVTCSVSS